MKCSIHPDARVSACNHESGKGRMCLSEDPHHLGTPPGSLRHRLDARYLMCQVDARLDKYGNDLRGARFTCPKCEHPVVARGRSGGRLIKVGCLVCGIEDDVPAAIPRRRMPSAPTLGPAACPTCGIREGLGFCGRCALRAVDDAGVEGLGAWVRRARHALEKSRTRRAKRLLSWLNGWGKP